MNDHKHASHFMNMPLEQLWPYTTVEKRKREPMHYKPQESKLKRKKILSQEEIEDSKRRLREDCLFREEKRRKNRLKNATA